MNNSIQTILAIGIKEILVDFNQLSYVALVAKYGHNNRTNALVKFCEQQLQTLERETRKEEIGRMNRFYVSLLRDIVTDQHERMRLKNVYGVDLDLEDTFIRMEELGAKIEKYLDELSHQKEISK